MIFRTNPRRGLIAPAIGSCFISATSHPHTWLRTMLDGRRPRARPADDV